MQTATTERRRPVIIGCAPVPPYRLGFEDFSYNRTYANPYPLASADWHKYDRGHADARCQALHILQSMRGQRVH